MSYYQQSPVHLRRGLVEKQENANALAGAAGHAS
ncbi:MAG: hypothetical protein JWO19_4036 [Bryobacterales bacterium]|nr:hypothetical protein [Bryobacterales bacterium]